jgi:hypothetical protein
VEAQVENTTQAKPQSIVEQLLEIAKKHDAMDVIGGSTSWRWQEGLITRMPKTKTVAAILTKAFKTDDPKVWLGRLDGELKTFIKNVYSVTDRDSLLINNICDKYEVLFLYTVMDERGATIDELKFKFSLFKYAEVFEDENLYFEDLEESLVVSINGDWALKRINSFVEKYSVSQDENGFYSLGSGYSFSSSESVTKHIRELEILRLRIVGYNSHFDMWRFFSRSLTDREMVYIERKMLDYYETLMSDINNVNFRFDLEEEKTRKSRIFSLSTMTIPNQAGEELRCNY